MSIALLLLVAAFVTTIASSMGKCPAFVPVLLICLVLLLQILPR